MIGVPARLGKAGLHVVIGLAFVAIPVLLVRYALVPGLQWAFAFDDDAASLIRRIAMIFALTGGYWAWLHWAQKRPAEELAFRPKGIGLSALAGMAAIAFPMGVLFALGDYRVTAIGTGAGLALIALFIFAAALLEEVIFRGVIFVVLERWMGTWPALIGPSLLFSLAHIFNDNWSQWLSVATGLLLGMMWTLVFMLTRNVWAAAVNHAVWNFTIILTGLPLTGQQGWRAAAPIQSEYGGPDWWTGGAAGPEDTVLVFALLIVIVALMIRAGQARGLFYSPVTRS